MFLLTAVEPAGDPDAVIGHRPGDFFVARAWQGKVALAAVLVPLLFALLHDHAARPRRRTLVLLGAAGAAAVGLSVTGTFLVPVIAVACLAPLALRAPRPALAGMAAASAYPLATLAATLLVGGHQPVEWRASQLAPPALVLPAVGSGPAAFVALAAALAAPLLLVPRHARLGVAGAVLVTALAFAPSLPQLIHELTGLGRPLWRLTWAMPVTALLGVAATQPFARSEGRAGRLLPAAAVVALLAVAGTPVWQGRDTTVARHPALKRPPEQIAVAERLARLSRPGDVVLAPEGLSATVLIFDGRLFAAAPRRRYTRALPHSPTARRGERLLLASVAKGTPGPRVTERRTRTALRRVGVDVACVRPRYERSRDLLVRAGYRTVLRTGSMWCGARR